MTKGPEPENTQYRNEDWLEEQYVEKERSLTEIANQLDVSIRTISTWVEKFGFEKRDSGEYSDSAVHRDEEWLRKKYIGEGKALSEVAAECDVHKDTIRRWLDRHGIERRGRGSQPGKDATWYGVTGEDHVAWKGGRTDQDYGSGWTESKRNAVRSRDGFECVDCGQSQEEHLDAYGQRLHVHHIKPASEVDEPEKRNSLTNLVTLCITCHLGKWEQKRAQQSKLPLQTENDRES